MIQKIRHLIYFILLIAADQASKLWVRTYIKVHGPIDIIPNTLSLQYHTNNGAVWGTFSGKVAFLRILTIVIFLLLLFLYYKIPKDRKYNALKVLSVFIMAGAIGNLIDRIYLGYVVDFIYFEPIDFPLFNLADSFLTVSCALLLILAIFYYKDHDFDFIDHMFSRKKKASSETSDDSDK